MRKLFTILIILFLMAGTASAAVYITFNPESKIWWSMDKPGPDVSQIQVLMPQSNDTFWSNTMSVELDDNDDFNTRLRFDNSNPLSVMGEVVIEITCDQGLFISPDGTVRDFDKFVYRDLSLAEHEGNIVGKFEIINNETIKFTPGDTEEFLAGSTDYGYFELGMVGMAYGNYTAVVTVEGV